jgi:hypothetical protein
MGEKPSRVELIAASSFGARSPIAATVPRTEFEEALRLEEVPELVLGVDSQRNGDVEAHTLRVAWNEDQLKELLRDTSGDDITLYFDADELLRALADEDIEAHGMRDKTAAVITVAAMAAGIGASAHAANAQTMGSGTTGGGSTIEMVSDAASSGVQAAPEMISDAASGPGVDVVRASGPELVSDAASGPGVDVATSSGPELVSDAASTGTLSPAQSSQVAAATSVAGDNSSWSASEIAGTAAIGGVVLLITAAGFAVRGRHRGGAQPA